MARRKRNYGKGLGAAPLLFLGIPAGKALIVGGAAAGAYLFSKRGKVNVAPQAPQAPVNPCDSAAIQKALVAGVQGAAAGGQAGVYGAGVGGTIGLALNPVTLTCGPQAINRAKAQLCKQADKFVSQLRANNVAIPKNWNTLSCDQKLAFVAAATTPLGLALGTVLLGAGVTLKLSKEAIADVNKVTTHVAEQIGNAAKDVEDAGQHAINQVTHLFGLGGLKKMKTYEVSTRRAAGWAGPTLASRMAATRARAIAGLGAATLQPPDGFTCPMASIAPRGAAGVNFGNRSNLKGLGDAVSDFLNPPSGPQDLVKYNPGVITTPDTAYTASGSTGGGIWNSLVQTASQFYTGQQNVALAQAQAKIATANAQIAAAQRRGSGSGWILPVAIGGGALAVIFALMK